MRAMSLSRHLNGLQHVSPSFFFFDVPPNSGALRFWGALLKILSGTCKRRSFFLGHCVPPESNAPIICLHSAQSNSAELRRSSGFAQVLLRFCSGAAQAERQHGERAVCPAGDGMVLPELHILVTFGVNVSFLVHKSGFFILNPMTRQTLRQPKPYDDLNHIVTSILYFYRFYRHPFLGSF